MAKQDIGLVLTFGEKILFDADKIFPRNAVLGAIFYCIMAIGFLFAGFAPNIFAALLGSVTAAVVGCVAAAFCLLAVISIRVQSSERRYVMTNTRIFSFSKEGRARIWRDGLLLDFQRDCQRSHRGNLSTVRLPTVQEDHGYPEWFSVVDVLPPEFDTLMVAFRAARSEHEMTNSSDTKANFNYTTSDANRESRSE